MNTLETINVKQLDFIAEIKQKIRQAQYEAMKSVNVQLINLYWEIGRAISEKQQEGWGKSVVPTLSQELQKEFPGATGYSERNLWAMAQFYTEYHALKNLQLLVAEKKYPDRIMVENQCPVRDNILVENGYMRPRSVPSGTQNYILSLRDIRRKWAYIFSTNI